MQDKKPSCRQDRRPYTYCLTLLLNSTSSCFRDIALKFDLSGSRDVISHVTISSPIGHSLLVVLWNKASTVLLTVSEIFNGECDAMVDMTLIRLRHRSRLFILVPIDFSYATSYRLSIITFALGRTVQPQYIPSQTTATDATLQHKRDRQCGRLKSREMNNGTKQQVKLTNKLRKTNELLQAIQLGHNGIEAKQKHSVKIAASLVIKVCNHFPCQYKVGPRPASSSNNLQGGQEEYKFDSLSPTSKKSDNPIRNWKRSIKLSKFRTQNVTMKSIKCV